MIIDDLLKNENMSRYRLSKESGVPMTTVTDICSGKTDIDKCAAGTLHKLAKTLGVSVDYILENNGNGQYVYRPSFETFKSNTCHMVKDMGDIDFIISTLENDEIRKLYKNNMFRESFYLLAMLDYLSKLNDLPICTKYDDIRLKKLDKPLFPAGIMVSYRATGDKSILDKAAMDAIPEFKHFNIIEKEVRDVY